MSFVSTSSLVLSVSLPLIAVASGCTIGSDDGNRAINGNAVEYLRGNAIGSATVRVCPDDGTVHSDWGVGCEVASATTDVDGAFRIEGLDADVYQVYVDANEPWGDHVLVTSVVDDDAAISFEIFPGSTASIDTAGDIVLSAPQLAFKVGDPSECGSNELVLSLPAYGDLVLEGEVEGCVEIENNPFIGPASFIETFRPPVAEDNGGNWSAEWGQVSRTPRRVGELNASFTFEEQEIQVSGTWID